MTTTTNISRYFGLAALLYCLSNASAESRVNVELDYHVPPQFTSTRQLLDSETLSTDQRESLEQQLRTLEELYGGTVVDLLVSNDESEEKYGIAITFHPIEENSGTAMEFFDDAFEWMEEMVSHLPDAADQRRHILKPDAAYGFHRMDVENAYGAPGNFASFLTRELHGHHLRLIIISDIDTHAPQFDAVINGLRVVEESGR